MEEVLALQPDLHRYHESNVDKLRSIAPTVAFDLEKRKKRLKTLMDIGEILGKKRRSEATDQSLGSAAQAVKECFEKEFDRNAVISVIGNYQTEFYIFGPNFGRGTEVLYTYLGLKFPEKLARDMEKWDSAMPGCRKK